MSLPPFKEAKKTNLNYTNPIVENYHWTAEEAD